MTSQTSLLLIRVLNSTYFTLDTLMLDTSGRSLTTELYRCDEVNLRKYEEIIITLLAPGKRCTFT